MYFTLLYAARCARCDVPTGLALQYHLMSFSSNPRALRGKGRKGNVTKSVRSGDGSAGRMEVASSAEKRKDCRFMDSAGGLVLPLFLVCIRDVISMGT